MSDLTTLLTGIAGILRGDPELRRLAPNWGADDARAHVFVGPPPVGAANTGRAPYVALDLADVRQAPRGSGDRPDAAATATVVVRLVARRDVVALAERVVACLSAPESRCLGDPDHVLGFAVEIGGLAWLAGCQALDLRLAVRLLAEPGA